VDSSSAARTEDAGVRQLLDDLAQEERSHEDRTGARHTLPFLIRDFAVAMVAAVIVVLLELG
jgi:hypothetical protein